MATACLRFLTFCPLAPELSSPCLNSCMTRSTVSFCGSDSRGTICHLHLTCLDLIKLGSDKAVPGALNRAVAALETYALEPSWSALVERHTLRADNGGSRMSARRTGGVEAADLSSRRFTPMEAKTAESLPNEPGKWQF